MSAQESPLRRIDLDANATTRPFPEVIDVVSQHLQTTYGNPGSRHAEGRQARRVLETSRERMAELLGARPNEVVFTSGGTEANNLALFGRAQGQPGTIAVMAGEHPATIEASRVLMQRGWTVLTLEVDSQGRLIDSQFDALPWHELRVVSVLLAHNETGVLQDVDRLSTLCRDHGVPLLIDAVQAVGKVPVSFEQLGASLLSLGAHKFHGPRGVGALLVRDGLKLAPLTYGGHQEADRRPGTESVALIAGMTRALELCLDQLADRTARLIALRERLLTGLQRECSPVIVNGSQTHCLPNTLNMAFPGVDGEALLVALDLAGIGCSLGSACASGSAEPSPILLAMRLPLEVYQSSVRFSLSTNNSLSEIDDAVARIARVVNRLRC